MLSSRTGTTSWTLAEIPATCKRCHACALLDCVDRVQHFTCLPQHRQALLLPLPVEVSNEAPKISSSRSPTNHVYLALCTGAANFPFFQVYYNVHAEAGTDDCWLMLVAELTVRDVRLADRVISLRR